MVVSRLPGQGPYPLREGRRLCGDSKCRLLYIQGSSNHLLSWVRIKFIALSEERSDCVTTSRTERSDCVTTSRTIHVFNLRSVKGQRAG